jgi:uncharacterized membrane protein
MKTKNDYKNEIKQKLSKLLAAQWNDVFQDFAEHPGLYTEEEARELTTCSDAVREIRAELEGVILVSAEIHDEIPLTPVFCVDCFNPSGACDCSDCS